MQKSNTPNKPIFWLIACFLFINPGSSPSHAQGEFVIHPETVMDTKQMEGWDGGEIEPGAVIFHDGLFHMFYNGNVREAEAFAIGYATSADGRSWNRIAKQPLIDLADIDNEGLNVAANSVLIEVDGTWVLYLSIAHNPRRYTGFVMRATASSPMGPWQIHPNPVLTPGEKNIDWDGSRVGRVSVNPTADGYVMHYTGWGRLVVDGYNEERGRIGLAYSEDGINWEKYNDPATTDPLFLRSDPVLVQDTTDASWEKNQVFNPNVQFENGRWTMAYQSENYYAEGLVGYATSDDGINWQRDSNNPVATRRDVKERGIWGASYLRHEDMEYIWLAAGWSNSIRMYLASRP